MAQPGCGIIFAPSQRIDRRNNLRRSFTTNSRTKHHTTDRLPGAPVQGPDMGFSYHTHSRSLSDRVRNMQLRRKKEQDIYAGKPQGANLHLNVAANTRKTPKHMDLLEAASQTDLDSLRRRPSSHMDHRLHADIGTGKENMPQGAKNTQGKPYAGDQTYRQIAYNQYLSQAFGLDHAGSEPFDDAIERLRRPEIATTRPDSDASAMTIDSMEVNFHMAAKDLATPIVPSAKDRRPKIHVQIPGKPSTVKRSTSTAHLASQINRQKTKGTIRQSSQISPPTATGSQDSEIPTRMSIVSPLSVMEMPKPRRPFSALSLEDMTNESSPSMPKSALSTEKSTSTDSSDDSGEADGRSSTYSGRSSKSSLSESTLMKDEIRRSIAFSILDPTMAGVFDSAPTAPKIKPRKSSTSLALSINKPLPPEPGMDEVQPLRLPNQSYSRGSNLHAKRKAPSPLNISRSPSIAGHPARTSSLRSKYTPGDLDALDAAFINSSPPAANFAHSRESSWDRAQNALEEHLGTIAEDDSASGLTVPLACDPLQISRGPNDMIPSRQAPMPPPSSMKISLSDGSVSSRNRLSKQSSKHIMMQMKSDGIGSSMEIRKRISAPVGGSLIKANRILGKSGSDDPTLTAAATAIQMEREASNDSNWSSSESPKTSYNGDSSSPPMSNRGDASTPETDISSIPDHTFEEIKARLDLLSPKNASPFFTTWGHRDPTSPVKQPNKEESDEAAQTQSSAIEDEVTSGELMSQTIPTFRLRAVPEVRDAPIKVSSKVGEAEGEAEDTALPRQRQHQGGDHEIPRTRSLASIAMSEIPDMYAELPTTDYEISAEEADRMISADAAEKVLLRILEKLDNLQDLFATATVSRGFYRTFKRHELPLMKNALYGMSPAAGELREMTPPYPGLEGDGSDACHLDYTPTLYLQHYMRDMYTMIALKSMILIHCESFLRIETITALAGGETERASQIDDAFWRVWTFCQIFGCGSNREDDIIAQMDWLRGGPLAKKKKRNIDSAGGNNLVFAPRVCFGSGNTGGLSAEDLYDMTEIWTCLGVLVRGFQGKRQEARDVGIFDNAKDLIAGDVEAEDSVLEEWTYHLLTLAPPTVLDVTSPTTPTAATFAHARSRGYASWTPPPVSRATFLKEAVSRVYQERIAEAHPASAPSSPQTTLSDPASPVQSDLSSSDSIASRWRCARHAAEIRAKRKDPNFKALPLSEDRPMSNYPAIFEKLDLENPLPKPALPSAVFNGSKHAKTPSESDTSKHMISALVVPKGPQVRDPVDVAVERLVSMGFESAKAKRALAETDTGNSVDFDGALEQLVRERKRDVDGLMNLGYRGRANSNELERERKERTEREEQVATPDSPVLGSNTGIGLGLGM